MAILKNKGGRETVFWSGGSIALVLRLVGLSGCAKPTEDECRAGIKHMMEIQIDESAAARAALPDGIPATKADTEWLKSQIPSLLKPEAIAQCVDRMKRDDLQCTMTTSTTEVLIHRCHWKVVPGPKGAALGF